MCLIKVKLFDIGSQTHYDVCFGRPGNMEVCYRKADLRYQLDANRWQWICNAEASSCEREKYLKKMSVFVVIKFTTLEDGTVIKGQ